jgi:hypothetical protein
VENQTNNQSEYVLDEMKKLVKKQSTLIAKQNNQLNKMMNDYRLMRILCYTLIAVTAIVFALIPAGYYVFNEIKEFLSVPTVWGAVLLLALLAFMVLAIILAGLLRRRSADYEEIIEVEEDDGDEN